MVVCVLLLKRVWFLGRVYFLATETLRCDHSMKAQDEESAKLYGFFVSFRKYGSGRVHPHLKRFEMLTVFVFFPTKTKTMSFKIKIKLGKALSETWTITVIVVIIIVVVIIIIIIIIIKIILCCKCLLQNPTHSHYSKGTIEGDFKVGNSNNMI